MRTRHGQSDSRFAGRWAAKRWIAKRWIGYAFVASGAIVWLLGVLATSFLDTLDGRGFHVLRSLAWLPATAPLFILMDFRLRGSRRHGIQFVCAGLGMVGVAAWILANRPVEGDVTTTVVLFLVATALSIALGIVALVFPQELQAAKSDLRVPSWFPRAKGRWSLARVLGLIGAVAGMVAAGLVFPGSIARGVIGVLLVGMAVLGAFRAGKDATSGFVLPLVAGVLGIFVGRQYWLPAFFILLAAAVSDTLPARDDVRRALHDRNEWRG